MYLYNCLSGTSDSVPVGGSSTIRLSRSDYAYAKGTTKPTAMALRLADKLFTISTLMHSTVNGTKEFAALDPSKIAAIKGTSQLALLKHFENIQLVIGLITVFGAILMGNQSGQKLQCLYGNPIANNFFQFYAIMNRMLKY